MTRRLRLPLALAVITAIALSPARAAAGEITLEQLLAAPFVDEITAPARSADRLAWVVTAAGRRSIWIATGPELRARVLVAGSDDDGRSIAELAFSGDGALLAYSRGVEWSHDETAPNPTHDPNGSAVEVWVAPLPAAASPAPAPAPFRIGEGRSPALSPDGKQLAFIRGGQLHVASGPRFATDRTVKLRGHAASPRWSPDGSAVAFVVDRRDHAWVAVYRPREQRLLWIDPGFGRDVGPRWSPDGSQLAFVRLPGARPVTVDHVAEAPWHAEPFALVVADAGTGRGRILHDVRARDAAFFLLGDNDGVWWADGRLLFLSESDGWQRLYAIAVSGAAAAPTALSPPGCEVHEVVVAGDGKSAIAVHNCDDRERRHLARVELATGTWKPLTSGRGLEWSPIALADGRVVVVSSTATQPGTPSLATATGLQPLTPPWSLPGLVEPQLVSWRSADGVTVHGDLLVPPTAAGGDRRPALLFLHGGPIRQLMPAWHPMLYYHLTYAMNQYLALHGFVVLAPNFRGGVGYGRAFREPPHRGAVGGAEYADVLSAGRFLQARPDVDPKRVGVWGGSYGGLLTAQALARDSALFAAGVDYAGVHDWSQLVFKDPMTPAASRKLAFASSPAAKVSSWRSPVLLIHGDDDNNVSFQQSIDLFERLRARRNVDVESLVLPDETHFLLRHDSWLAAMHATVDFFDRRLAATHR
jgi:dipeptidyl aminopeptidase/acylaminoacyl peptidase